MGRRITRTLNIGPQIEWLGQSVNGNQMTVDLRMTNHDVMQGVIRLDLLGLPAGWTGSFSNGQARIDLTIGANQNAPQTLTLTNTQGPIDPQPLQDSHTRVVATFQRIPDRKDAYIICPQDSRQLMFAAGGSAEGGMCPARPGQAVILAPANGQEFESGASVAVEVRGTLVAQSAQVRVKRLSNGATETLTSTGREHDIFHFQWLSPTVTRREGFELTASVDGLLDSDPVTVYAAPGGPSTGSVEFIFPTGSEPPFPIGQPINVQVRIGLPAGAVLDEVELSVPFAGGANHDYGGAMTQDGAGNWERNWTPDREATAYNLLVKVWDASDQLLPQGSTIVQTLEGAPAGGLSLRFPSLAFTNTPVTIQVVALNSSNRRLWVSGTERPLVRDPADPWKWIYTWSPARGSYAVRAQAQFAGGATEEASGTLTVIDGPTWEIVNINPNAILGTVRDQRLEGPLELGGYIPAPIYPGFVSAVVGFHARGGDIGEDIDHDIDGWFYPDLVGLLTRGYLMADFNTWHHETCPIFCAGDYVDRPETWDVSLLWLAGQIAERRLFPGLGDNVSIDTGIRFDEYACGIAGFWAHDGDINESGTGDIFQMYVDRQNQHWRIRADFRTHHAHEDWDVDLICLRREVASLDGPAPDKPYFIQEFKGLGDNVGPSRPFSTHIPTSDYACGVVGFAALDGDIDEHDESSGTNLISAYTYDQGGEWHIRADFRTHNNSESWNVNILCAPRQGRPSMAEWNTSRLTIRNERLCLADVYHCQVLQAGSINLSGEVVLKGGGYTGRPSGRGRQCSTDQHVGVYINDRDPSTGRPRWSAPSQCLRDGDRLTLVAGNTYDLLGVSLVGGRPLPFELRDPDGPVELTGALPTEFPVPWGSGMALTWKPTLHPSAKYYEVQFSEDNGAIWRVYTTNRDVSHGGWINHHGELGCNDIYSLCLKSAQPYSYRVRVLNASGVPLTGWSNVLSAGSLDWATLNDPPGIVDAPPTTQGLVGQTVSFTVSASDPEGQPITLLVEGLPPNASLEPATGTGSLTATFSWTPDSLDVGLHTLTFTVRDARGALSAAWFTDIVVMEDCGGEIIC